ncbi:hypothetical protein [Actinomycetospora aeridis]|uniref:Uncharacterized protein n=1 Tax=Actinomycetospora aeridis TaxID=3129231 RepID=A0ABU8MZV4_9PSEU
MTSQAMGHRVLVLGAGVLLLGSLGVGAASATSSTDNTCVEVTTYDHPRYDHPTSSPTSSSSTTTTTTTTTSGGLPPITIPGGPTITIPSITLPPVSAPSDTLQDGGGQTSSPLTGSSPVDSGDAGPATPPGDSGVQELRADDPAPGSGDDDSDLDEGPNSLTTTDRGEGYDSGYDYDGYRGPRGSYGGVSCYYNYSVGHYWYDHRPVGEVRATQVKRVPSGGVDTGN